MQKIKIGMIGLDTSHVISLLAHFNDPSDPHGIPGFHIAKAFPGGSANFSLSKNRVEGYTEQIRSAGVEIVDSIQDLADMDAFLLTSVDGSQHLEQFSILAEYGKPVYIDKPLACSYSDARLIVRKAEEKGIPLMSCSSLRYAVGIADILQEDDGGFFACHAFGPMDLLTDYRDYFWYGIHTAEILFSVLGKGLKSVKAAAGENGDLITGTWDGGRFGSIWGNRLGNWEFGCTVSGSKINRTVKADTSVPYDQPLAGKIAEFFRSGKSPLDIDETLEVIAFLEAASRSRRAGGAAIEIASFQVNRA